VLSATSRQSFGHEQFGTIEGAKAMMDKPSKYPLRSLQSRTAARAMLERLKVEEEKNAIAVTVEFIGLAEGNRSLKFYTTGRSKK
jgi:hypothetical protein